MKGTNHDGYLMRGNEPYATPEEAYDRIRRIQRDNPEMRGNSLRAGKNVWYYEVVRYGKGWAVESSYTVNQ